jgi:hypothetical protein
VETVTLAIFSVIVAVLVKPVYYVQLSTIAILQGKKPFPPIIWRYGQAEAWSLSALFISLFFLFRFPTIWLGIATGGIGIAYLFVIHCKYIALMKRE